MRRFNSAVILAGGRSTRMGFDKQLLETRDIPITHHLISLLYTRFDDVMISSPTPELYQDQEVRVIQDIYKGVGPLGGIHGALMNAKSIEVFVIACDMPFLEMRYVDYMISLLADGNFDACVTSRGGYLETMHAFYCRSALPVLENELNQKRYSVQHFVKKINALIIPEKQAAPLLPGWSAFINLNRPEEYERFRKGDYTNEN